MEIILITSTARFARIFIDDGGEQRMEGDKPRPKGNLSLYDAGRYSEYAYGVASAPGFLAWSGSSAAARISPA